MEELKYVKTGTNADREPTFQPIARSLFMVLEENKKHEMKEEEFLTINLHAQKELCAQSSEFEKAQDHWSNLPKTPKRHLDNSLSNRYNEVPKIEEDTIAQEWMDEFKTYEGLVYIFNVTREIDLTTGETRKPFPVVGFSLGGGLDFLDDIKDKDCVRYRLYYAFAEKP